MMKKKMKFLFRPGALIAAALLISGVFASAQSASDAQVRKRTFGVADGTTLEIENKYGTILIVPWTKDSVQVRADIFLEAKNNSRLRKLKNDVNINFAGTRSYIIARTVIGEGSSRVASELRALSNTLSSKSTVEINYTVYLPEYINLVLINKFGDIYIDNLEGDVDIQLSNGVLKANHFNGRANVDLSFARGTVRSMGTASANLSYGELTVGAVRQLDLVSKSSEVEIDTAGVVKIDSRRDKIWIEQVEYLYGHGSFTDVEVGSLSREADCMMKYGKLVIEQVQSAFTEIDIESDYTDVTLNVAPATSYRLDMIHNEKAVVDLPGNNAQLTTKPTGEDFLTTEGSVGPTRSGDPGKYISIRAQQKCYIIIRSR